MQPKRCRLIYLLKIFAIFVFIESIVISQYHHLAMAGSPEEKHPDFDYEIELHELNVRFDMPKHLISATDKMKIQLKSAELTHIAFMLNKSLGIREIRIDGYEDHVDWESIPGDDEYIQMIKIALPATNTAQVQQGEQPQITPFTGEEKDLSPLESEIQDTGGNKPQTSMVIKVDYEGEIYNPVKTAKELGHLRGDITTGLISEEGIYLSNGTYWYPTKPKGLSLFKLEAELRDPYRIVAQGELKERISRDGLSISRWESVIPADGLSLVGGQYIINTKAVDQVEISTYFFKEDEAMSDMFIDAAARYIKMYSEILGKYPYKRFDIVENFFSTGYGMPGFTLLGNYVIKQGQMSLQPGYLDHEIVHSWFGNYVFNDMTKGNWVEALTTYCANYYYKELILGHDEAVNHRKRDCLKYSIRATKEKEYPVRKFMFKTEEFENEIGYTKGSMSFHQLRKTVGDEIFFNVIREFVKRFGGGYAEWDDIQALFEEMSKLDLGWFFSQWLDRKGAPELRLENVELKAADKGYLIKGEVVQSGDVYRLSFPIHIDLGGNGETFDFDTDEPRKGFELRVDRAPISLALDPEYHLFRRIAPDDITPCLNALLEDDDKAFVYPSGTANTENEVYKVLAENASERKGGLLISDADTGSLEKISSHSIFIAGEARNSEYFEAFYNYLPDGVKLGKDYFAIDGERYEGQDYSLLISFRNPVDTSNFVTLYFGLSPQAISRSRYIFFYGWDSYVAFKNGRPIKRGDFTKRISETVYEFSPSMISSATSEHITSEYIIGHIKRLASEELAGRYPGTKGDGLARDYIIERFKQYNIAPAIPPEHKAYEQGFKIRVIDLKDSNISFRKGKKEVSQYGIPLNFSSPGTLESGIIMAGYGIYDQQSETAYDDYKGIEDQVKGKAVVIMDGMPDFYKGLETSGYEVKDRSQTTYIQSLFKKIEDAQRLGASAAIIYASSDQIDKYAIYLAYPSLVPKSIMEDINKKKEEGKFASIEIELSRRISMRESPSFEVKIPIILIPYDAPENKEIEKYLKLSKIKNKINMKKKPCSKEIKNLSLDINIEYSDREFPAYNIIGYIEGSDPVLKDEIIVLGAHYDHLGINEEGNIFYGADDNASGVAAMLEIARALYDIRGQIKRTVMFVAFGAEEWGLLGSKFFVNNPISPEKRIVSMLNMDSIGRGAPSEVWLIGSSIHPELSLIAERYMKALGLQEAKNIDGYAFKHGSDHYPFHVKGIPSLDFCSTNYRELHKTTDTWEGIDRGKVEKIARLVFLTLFELATR